MCENTRRADSENTVSVDSFLTFGFSEVLTFNTALLEAGKFGVFKFLDNSYKWSPIH